MKKNKLIIYSGGLDSTVLLNDYQESIALAVTFDYGSKHNDWEYEYAKKNTAKLGIEHIRVDLKKAFEFVNSDLLKNGGEIPDGHYEHESMKATVVPFRNGIMLSVAASIAESRDLKVIMIANHSGDHAIYPDCREDFIDAIDIAITRGTATKVMVQAPYTVLNKRSIAQRGQRLNIDFSQTYSCYKGGAFHCGTCGTCVERKEALQGFDTTKYLK